MKVLGIVLAVAVLAAVVFFALRKPAPVDRSAATYTGPIGDYKGGKRLIIVFTASWASFWKLTAEEIKKIDRERFDVAILDQATDQAQIRQFGITFLPTVALFENGQLTKRVQNLTSIDQIKDW